MIASRVAIALIAAAGLVSAAPGAAGVQARDTAELEARTLFNLPGKCCLFAWFNWNEWGCGCHEGYHAVYDQWGHLKSCECDDEHLEEGNYCQADDGGYEGDCKKCKTNYCSKNRCGQKPQHPPSNPPPKNPPPKNPPPKSWPHKDHH